MLAFQGTKIPAETARLHVLSSEAALSAFMVRGCGTVLRGGDHVSASCPDSPCGALALRGGTFHVRFPLIPKDVIRIAFCAEGAPSGFRSELSAGDVREQVVSPENPGAVAFFELFRWRGGWKARPATRMFPDGGIMRRFFGEAAEIRRHLSRKDPDSRPLPAPGGLQASLSGEEAGLRARILLFDGSETLVSPGDQRFPWLDAGEGSLEAAPGWVWKARQVDLLAVARGRFKKFPQALHLHLDGEGIISLEPEKAGTTFRKAAACHLATIACRAGKIRVRHVFRTFRDMEEAVRASGWKVAVPREKPSCGPGRLSPAMRGFAVQARVVMALILFEIATLYGDARLGYLWALAKTAFGVLVLLMLRIFSHARPSHGISAAMFLIAGFLVWQAFSQTLNKTLTVVKNNKNFLTFPHVSPVDIIIARALVIVSTESVCAAVLALSFHAAGLIPGLHFPDMPLLLASIGGAAAFGIGCGCACLMLSCHFPAIARIVPLLLRVFFFASGVFFSVSSFSHKFGSWLMLNPVMQLIEMARKSLAPAYPVYYDAWYLWACVPGTLFLGLLLERKARKLQLV